jgi:hypothetical protein
MGLRKLFYNRKNWLCKVKSHLSISVIITTRLHMFEIY